MKRVLVMLISLVTLTPVLAADSSVLGSLRNMREPQANRIVSGAIDAADLGRIRAAGIKHVVDLRTAEERAGFDEAGIATGLGLGFHSIPIKGAQSLTKENAMRLDELLRHLGDEPVLVHCASGNRVGALIAVREAWIQGKSTEEAIAEGKRWGLTSLESSVRTILDQSPVAPTHE